MALLGAKTHFLNRPSIDFLASNVEIQSQNADFGRRKRGHDHLVAYVSSRDAELPREINRCISIC